jgi:PAS domain S-box-containing protein
LKSEAFSIKTDKHKQLGKKLEALLTELTRELPTSEIIPLAKSVMQELGEESFIVTDDDYAGIIAYSAKDAVIMLDDEGKVLFWNPAAERIFGYSESEIAGKKLERFIIPEKYIKAHQDGYQRFTKNKSDGFVSKTLELTGLRKDGEEFPLELSLSSYKKGESWQAVGIIRDITDRKKVELKLYQAKVNAEDATAIKDKFVSLVAHDLRAPFSSILGLIEILLKDKTEPLTSKQRQILERTKKGGKHLVGMIDKLLNINHLRTGRIHLNKMFHDLRRTTHNFTETLSYMAESKGITVTNDTAKNTRIYTDFSLLGEVIQNLVSNAIKFCEPGDTIRIYSIQNEKTVLVVEDTGVGMDDEFLLNLFKSEVKTSRTGTAGEVGTGLGLPFCHDIMLACGGNLRVESEKGKGTSFFAELPIVVPKVLVVDGDDATLSTIDSLLKREGYEIVMAKTPRQAIEIIEEDTVHLVLTQFDKPDIENLHLLKTIRHDSKNPEIPIIAMTSGDATEIKETFTPQYINNFVQKPINKEDLLHLFRKFLM